jgi:hypothetical protein
MNIHLTPETIARIGNPSAERVVAAVDEWLAARQRDMSQRSIYYPAERVVRHPALSGGDALELNAFLQARFP